jgi:hypothetical protein
MTDAMVHARRTPKTLGLLPPCGEEKEDPGKEKAEKEQGQMKRSEPMAQVEGDRVSKGNRFHSIAIGFGRFF